MVLPVRIELTTSALPRMRSTTELLQHFRKKRAYDGAPLGLSTRPFDFAQDMLAATRRAAHVAAMAGKDTDDDRSQRLAAALRENLKRRKAQARQAAAVAARESNGG